jgi:hypothetical protein
MINWRMFIHHWAGAANAARSIPGNPDASERRAGNSCEHYAGEKSHIRLIGAASRRGKRAKHLRFFCA